MKLPFHQALEKIEACPEQKWMANSTQQARNVDGSLAIGHAALPEGPVLLVDDMVDSRWTSTVAAWLLRSKACNECCHKGNPGVPKVKGHNGTIALIIALWPGLRHAQPGNGRLLPPGEVGSLLPALPPAGGKALW